MTTTTTQFNNQFLQKNLNADPDTRNRPSLFNSKRTKSVSNKEEQIQFPNFGQRKTTHDYMYRTSGSIGQTDQGSSINSNT